MPIDQTIRNDEPTDLGDRSRRPSRGAVGSRWMNLGLALLMALAAFLLLQLACRSGVGVGKVKAGPAHPEAVRVIEVDGTARLDIPPDRVDLSLTLEEQRTNPAAAARALRKRRQGLLLALKMLGLPRKEIVISLLNMHPQYKRYPERGIDSYVAQVTLIATIRDPERLADYVEAAAAAGVARMHTTFRSTRMQELKKRVRELALKAARTKAEQIAKAMGVEVGQVRTVRENAHGNWQGSSWWRGTDNVSNSVEAISRPGAAGGKASRPDTIKLHLSVVVAFAMR
ncbi:MAG: SIMPL domain-containing protein [bacterium]